MKISPSAIPQKISSLNEKILVVKRTHLFPAESDAWYGLKPVNFDHYVSIINKNKEFLPRTQMEEDPTYKQIIPYLIFNFQDRYFLMQRQAKASEARLQNKYSLGIGGHIRQEDLIGSSIFDWAHREFHEEVFYNGTFTIESIGILNDDSNSVGQVHLGFVLLLRGNSDAISIKSELKSGMLVTLDECRKFATNLESWSQIVLEHLR